MRRFTPILALIWGCAWALILQFSLVGRWLVARRAWITVVVGIGVDLVLLRPLLKLTDWLKVVALVALSSLGIISRSLYNEWHDHQALLHRARTGGLR